jgi:hypothetical protein
MVNLWLLPARITRWHFPPLPISQIIGPLRAAVNPAEDEHGGAMRAGHLHGKRPLDFILRRRGFDHGQGRVHGHFGKRALGQPRSRLKLQ